MKKRDIRIMPWMFLAAAIVFTVAGVFRGEAAAVLGKAIKICLECVGIG